MGQTLGCIRLDVQVDIGDGLIDISGVVVALPGLVLVERSPCMKWFHGSIVRIEKRASAAVWHPHRLIGTKCYLGIANAR
jgi:hypothetical protein